MDFTEDLYTMEKKTQQHPAGGAAITWSRGTPFKAKLQLDNSMSVQVAMAQGVKTSGYLAIKVDELTGKPLTPISINTYIEFPKANLYVRVADIGIVEAGRGIFVERQYGVEAVHVLPN